jgi:5-formyltetrahydrofolate cyclo-ligase
MPDTIREAKRALRQQVRAALSQLGSAERIAASAQARARLAAQPLWQKAQSVLFFAPLAGELDLWPLLIEALSVGKHVALPRFIPEEGTYEACPIHDLEQDLQAGHFGIREPNHRCPPLSSDRLDLILVPGVAFDPRGRRLGRGKGYYDQLLTTLRGATCGVAFDQQVVEEIPVEPHDVRLDCLLTPTRWLETRA